MADSKHQPIITDMEKYIKNSLLLQRHIYDAYDRINESDAADAPVFVFENGAPVISYDTRVGPAKYTLRWVAESVRSAAEFVEKTQHEICDHFDYDLSKNDKHRLSQVYEKNARK